MTGGCVKSNGLPGTPSRETSPTLPAGTVSPTAISIRLISSATPLSTLTPTPTLTLAPTYTSTPSTTPTVIPTLPVEAARIRLLDLLANNGNCSLPCLWGITPGESTFQDARIILEPLSSISDFTDFSPGPGAIDPIYTIGDLMIYTTIRFITYPATEIVSYIIFEARALKEMIGESGVEDVFDSRVFGERLSLYMLPRILSQYGRPSSVLLSTLAEFPDSRYGQGHFQILLLYPDQGILVHYTTEMSVVGANVIGCPSNAHIELELYPSGNGESFLDNLEPSWQNEIQNNYKPLEEVTSMSTDDFYQLYRQPTNECLVTPSNLWPVPER